LISRLTAVAPAPGARILKFEDGTVVFDPIAGRTRVLAAGSMLILEFLRDAIADGCSGREALLALLEAEVAGDPDAQPGDSLSGPRLLEWVDLARHLYT
jgi:hypothetical protein